VIKRVQSFVVLQQFQVGDPHVAVHFCAAVDIALIAKRNQRGFEELQGFGSVAETQLHFTLPGDGEGFFLGIVL